MVVLVDTEGAQHRGQAQHYSPGGEHGVGKIAAQLIRHVARQTVLVTIALERPGHTQIQAAVTLTVQHSVPTELALLAHHGIPLITGLYNTISE